MNVDSGVEVLAVQECEKFVTRGHAFNVGPRRLFEIGMRLANSGVSVCRQLPCLSFSVQQGRGGPGSAVSCTEAQAHLSEKPRRKAAIYIL